MLGQAKFGVMGDLQVSDTVLSNNENVTFSFIAQNKGDSAFTGLLVATFKFPKALVATQKNVTDMLPGDTVLFSLQIVASLPYFDEGENIVVAWPTGTILNNSHMIEASDSSMVKVDFQFNSSVSESNYGLNRVRMYPNPASGKLFIEPADNAVIKHIRICDMTGKVQYIHTGLFNEIDISALRPGLFLVSVRYKDDTEEVLKLVVDR